MERVLITATILSVALSTSGNLLGCLKEDFKSLVKHFGINYLTIILKEIDRTKWHRRKYFDAIHSTGVRVNAIPWNIFAGTSYQHGAVLAFDTSYSETKTLVGRSDTNRPVFFCSLDSDSIPDTLTTIGHIPYRSRVLVLMRDRVDASGLTLKEAYHVQTNMAELVVNELGQRVRDSDGTARWRFDRQSELMRRSNLHGGVIRVIYPLLMFDKVDVTGLARGVWAGEIFLHTVTRKLNVRYKEMAEIAVYADIGCFDYSIEPLRLADRNLLGAPDASGRWPGIVGVLQRDDADLSVMATSPALRHVPHVEFLASFFHIDYKLYYRAPGTQFSLETMVHGFAADTWMALTASLALLSSALYLVSMATPPTPSQSACAFQPSECLLTVLGDFCLAGWCRIPCSKAGHVLCACSVLLGFLVNLVYVSQLQANLAVTLATPPFEDLEGVVTHAQYNVLMLEGTLPHQYVLSEKTGVMRSVGDLMRRRGNAIVPGFIAGMTRVCTEPATLLGISTVCDTLASKAKCAVAKSKKSFFRRGLTFYARKRFELKKLLDFYIRKCLEGGLYMGQKGRFDWEDISIPRDDGTGFQEVEFHSVVPFLLLYASCVSVAIAVLLLEIGHCACVGSSGRRRLSKRPERTALKLEQA